MKEDCRNDCVDALRFPKKLDNRPGLSHLDYRIGDYADIREALLRNLDKDATLSAWTHRGVDDPGIALLEGVSILGDILTFYQERYANEAYLRTAEWRESISDLVRLLGYHLSPGLGGRASFAFEVKGDQPVAIPPNFPLKAEVEGASAPVDFETVSPVSSAVQTIAYPWLSKFNLYEPLTTPQISDTTTEFYVQAPAGELTSSVRLKVGDRLIIGDVLSFTDQLNNAEIIIVDSIRELHGVQLFKIKGKLKRSDPADSVVAYKLGRSFHHFGCNGPRKKTALPAQTKATSEVAGTTTTTTTTLPAENNISFFRAYTTEDFTISTPYTDFTNIASTIKIVEPRLTNDEFPLDGEVDDLPVGAQLVIQASLYRFSDQTTPLDFTLLRKVTNVRSTSFTWGLSTGTSSIVTLDNVLMGVATDFYFIADIRSIQFHETVSPFLTLRAAMQPSVPPIPDTLNFYGTAAQAQNLLDRELIFVKEASEPLRAKVITVEAPSAVDGTHPLLHKITLDYNALNYADFPNEPPYTITVYGNIVEATQGKTEKVTPLGNGDSRLVFQTFKLPKSPLTYLRSESSTPPEVPELKVYVNNRVWRRVPSFFGRQPDEQIYIVREDPQNVSWVQFGDGRTGARLPSGVKNVTAVYRSGTGAFGALKEKTKVQAGAKLDRLDKVQMPTAATGGAEPEDGENARAAAPGKIQSLDRLVSLEDFEREALGMAGITKARASWELVGGIPQVTLTLLMGIGRTETEEEWGATFAHVNSDRGPNRFPIRTILGQLKYVALRASFGYDSTFLEADVRQGILKALGVSSGKLSVVDDPTGLFSLARRNFGQKEYATTVAGVIQQVEGVVWASVDKFDAPVTLVSGSTIGSGFYLDQLSVINCPNNRVLALQTGHLELTATPEVRT